MNKVLTLLIASVILLSGCTKPDTARRVLKDSGYTDITIKGPDIFACGKDDTFSTGFSAKNNSGVYVVGTVCSGLFKGNTIRLN